MTDFKPIDHKETDADYASEVRIAVAKIVDATFADTIDPSLLVGRWQSSLPDRPGPEFDVEHLADGTLALSGEQPEAEPGKWEVRGDAYIQTTWVPPMPEYGIESSSWEQDAYRWRRKGEAKKRGRRRKGEEGNSVRLGICYSRECSGF